MSEPVTDFDKLLASLEPAATRGESEWVNVAQLSAAVSLKRIADALWGTDSTSGIIELLNGIEMNGRAP